MLPVIFASFLQSQLWHFVPLVVAISLVYGATRHELMHPILANAFKFGVWIVGFVVVIALILFLVSTRL